MHSIFVSTSAYLMNRELSRLSFEKTAVNIALTSSRTHKLIYSVLINKDIYLNMFLWYKVCSLSSRIHYRYDGYYTLDNK